MKVGCSERQRELKLHVGCTTIEHKQKNAFIFTAPRAFAIEFACFVRGPKNVIYSQFAHLNTWRSRCMKLGWWPAIAEAKKPRLFFLPQVEFTSRFSQTAAKPRQCNKRFADAFCPAV